MPVSEELSAILLTRERMFICPPVEVSDVEIEILISPEFRETGASGSCYDYTNAVDTLKRRRINPPDDNWEMSGYDVRRLSEDIVIATYMLHQGVQNTRRTTIWRCERGVWRAVFHQGTIIQE